MVSFTRTHDFRLALAYHSQGRVIYWNYLNLAPPESLTIANAFARVSGYIVSDVLTRLPMPDTRIGLYRSKKTGFTIEVGLGQNPLPYPNLILL